MVSKGLLVRMDVKSGKDAEADEFLRGALPLAQQEKGTIAWFALRFGRGEYGIFDAFADDAGRDAHLAGPIAQQLMARADALLEKPASIRLVDVLAEKLPIVPAEFVTKGLVLTFKAKTGNAAEVEKFLKNARPLVVEEPRTVAWFGLRFDDGYYGIFDVFPDNGARLAHLAGHVPRELMKHALDLVGSIPDMDMVDILAAKLEGMQHKQAA
jgi:quinol monooxygenase YgiN